MIQISAPKTTRLTNIPKRTMSNCRLRLLYKRMDPENNAIDPPKPPKVDALAVAANVAPSKAYIGSTNAANALRIAAANK